MKLAPYQSPNTIYLFAVEKDMNKLPKPDHITDYQDETLCLEFTRSITNLIVLQLCGVKL